MGAEGVVPESMAPQEEMYPFVPGCDSTQWAGVNTDRNVIEDIFLRIPLPLCGVPRYSDSSNPWKKTGSSIAGTRGQSCLLRAFLNGYSCSFLFSSVFQLGA